MKKQHPIRKMQRAEQDVWAGRGGGRASSLTDLNNQSGKVIARHVKPLLDALEAQLETHRKVSAGGVCRCYRCRLLAEWRKPL